MSKYKKRKKLVDYHTKDPLGLEDLPRTPGRKYPVEREYHAIF